MEEGDKLLVKAFLIFAATFSVWYLIWPPHSSYELGRMIVGPSLLTLGYYYAGKPQYKSEPYFINEKGEKVYEKKDK